MVIASVGRLVRESMHGTSMHPTFEGRVLLATNSNGNGEISGDVWCSEVTIPLDTRTKYPMLPANRSAGCAVCRRRKVKCDETWPQCLKCQRAKLECTGPRPLNVFVDQSPATRPVRRRSRATAFGSSAASSSTDSLQQRAQTKAETARGNSPSSDTDSNSGRTRNRSPSGRPSWPSRLKIGGQVVSPVLQDTQLMYHFAAANSPRNPVWHRNLADVIRGPVNIYWGLHALAPTNQLLRNATRTVTLAHMGRVHSSEKFAKQAHVFYAKTLHQLQQTLTDRHLGLADETLAATVLLSMYEMISSEVSTPWVKHAGGVAALLRMRGPERHRTGLGRQLLFMFIGWLVHYALEMDEACILEEPEWVKLFENIRLDAHRSNQTGAYPDFYDAHHRWRHQLTHIPGVIKDARSLERDIIAGMTVDQTRLNDLFIKARDRRREMAFVFDNFRRILEQDDYLPQVKTVDDAVFPIAYQFANITIANFHMTYWAMSVIINSVLKELDPVQKADYEAQNVKLAVDACQCCWYMHQSKFFGATATMIALQYSLLAFRDEERRGWCVQKLQELGDTRIATAKDIPDHHPDDGLPGIRRVAQEATNLDPRVIMGTMPG